MNSTRCYPLRLYLKKIVNTFFPGILFRLSPKKFFAQRHWREQDKGDIHGFDNYLTPHPRIPILIAEIEAKITRDQPVLDLGCNCGYYLSRIKEAGFSNLAGVDIAPAAIQYGKEHLNLQGVDLTVGSFEEVIPQFIKSGRKFDLVYSMGATIELVHPSFDIIGNICSVSNRYVVLIISEWGHEYPRFWEYEFNRNGFFLTKKVYPYDGKEPRGDPVLSDSLLIFERP
jgi:SAM-dependent methyltransferase